jgi:hypothetical protein
MEYKHHHSNHLLYSRYARLLGINRLPLSLSIDLCQCSSKTTSSSTPSLSSAHTCVCQDAPKVRCQVFNTQCQTLCCYDCASCVIRNGGKHKQDSSVTFLVRFKSRPTTDRALDEVLMALLSILCCQCLSWSSSIT